MITSFFKNKGGDKAGKGEEEGKERPQRAEQDPDWTPGPLPDPADVRLDALEEHIEESWRAALADTLSKPYWKELGAFLAAEERANQTVFPPRHLVFNAFRLTPLPRVRVVVIGQDPYHGKGQAEGLSFSVPRGQAVPSSLRNMFKELGTDVPGFRKPGHGSLVRWAEQGVLMLNTVLTVRQNTANSHRKKGWETFTSEVVRVLAQRKEPVVFLLWGKQAQANTKLIRKVSGQRHKILESPHPSGLSAHRGFFGCKHFSKANALLTAAGYEPIDWNT